MLSRVADSLYWMSRYLERAENLARFLDVNHQVMWDQPLVEQERLRADWSPIISCLGINADFRASKHKSDSDSVTEFLIFDDKNPHSVLMSIRYARENARAVRQEISMDMWEHLNRSYLWLHSKAARHTFQRNIYEFLQKIMEMSQLFQGITTTTMPHNEGWDFIQLGKYIERAEKTSRFIDDKFHLLKKPADLLQWNSILRMCSARQAYQKKFLAGVDRKRVVHLLMQDEAFPRSIIFCLRQADDAVRRIGGIPEDQFGPAERVSGRLLAELRFTNLDEVASNGKLHDFVDHIQMDLNTFAQAFYNRYINYV